MRERIFEGRLQSNELKKAQGRAKITLTLSPSLERDEGVGVNRLHLTLSREIFIKGKTSGLQLQ